MHGFLSIFLLPLIALHNSHLVHAHGYVSKVSIDGKIYIGNVPNASPTPAIVRQINDVAPVKNASNPYLNCGQAAQKAALVADANPGSQIQFWWNGGDGSPWPHNIGPLMTYMASCVNTTCDQYDSTNAMWFKIEQTALQPGNTTWYQQNIMDGGPANVTIPSDLAPGQYLIRHEIIALHLATQLGGAEFYPSCTQVNVHGNQAGTPTSSEEVTFPGGYSDTDPGIYDPSVFDIPVQYTFPGPSLAALVTDSSSSSSSASSSGTPTHSSSPSTPSSGTSTNPPPSSTSLVCKLTSQQAFSMRKRRTRSVSRIMGEFFKGLHL